MIHNMRIHNEPFILIQNGIKTYELRLNDEKRRVINIGDKIRFTNRVTNEQLIVNVKNILHYNSFKELYEKIDPISIGYKESDKPDYKDMEQYYSNEEIEKYGVIALEITPDIIPIKEVHNEDNLDYSSINRVVKRAKLLIENNNNEILVVKSHNNSFFVGGHVENTETDMECLHREVLEEAGVDYNFEDLSPFMIIKYLNKDYPEVGINQLTIANYYSVKDDFIPNLESLNLTDDEKDGNFTIIPYNKDTIISDITNTLESATRPNVTKDTIKVIDVYLQK